MKDFKSILKIFSITAAFIVVICYAFFLFILPGILSSEDNVAKYEKFIEQKTGIPFVIKDLCVKAYPDLSLKIMTKGLYAVSETSETLVHVDGLEYRANILNIKHGKLDADYIFSDISKLKKYINFSNNKEKKSFNLSFVPKINIKRGHVKFSDKTYAQIDYIKTKTQLGKITTQLLAKVYSPYTRKPLIIGRNGAIEYSDRLSFDNFSAKVDDSVFYLSGSGKNLNIKGHSIPVKELEKSFLYFYKLKNPNKKNFIENFTDFQGKLDIDLVLKKEGITGECRAHDLGAKFSDFKIPVFLPETKFIFENRQIRAKSKGTFGPEPVTTDFLLTGLLTKDLHVKGDVHSIFTNKITQKYFPAIQIQGVADADVKYHTHNDKVDVYYTLTINKGNNLVSDYGALDNTNKKRRIYMHTTKQGTPIKISDYDYSVYENAGYYKILYGDGNFDKINGHYKLSNLSLKSNDKVSVNYIRSFLRNYVKDGTFDADINFDPLSKSIIGYMNFYNVSHDNFLYLKNTNINLMKEKISLNSQGSFYGSPYKAAAQVSNKIKDKILIHDIDVHLNSFFVQKGKLTSIPQSFTKEKKKPIKTKKKLQIDVEQGRVVVDRIYSRKFNVTDVNIQGSLKNDIAHFIIPKALYANGILTAKGIYNLVNYSSDIQFFASDIDSNIVVTEFFKLPGHVTGSAYATLDVKTKNKLNDIKAKATFAISDGYLPKIASQEFILGKSSKKKNSNKRPSLLSKLNIKVSLSKIVNIDFSKPNNLYTNVYGSFNLDNEFVRNIKLYSKSDIFSLFIEGDYDIETQSGKIDLWGKRNKTLAKKIRIFKIPLNLIYRIVFRPEHSQTQYEDKIKQIPAIKASIADDIAIFRVSASGNMNDTKHLKIIMKDLR